MLIDENKLEKIRSIAGAIYPAVKFISSVGILLATAAVAYAIHLLIEYASFSAFEIGLLCLASWIATLLGIITAWGIWKE